MGASLSSLSPSALALAAESPSAPPTDKTRRMGRLAAVALLAFLYARRTAASVHDQHAVLSLHDAPLSRAAHVRAVLRYTFWGQLIAGSEFLLCLVKPALCGRIGRSLVCSPKDAVCGLSYGPHARHTLDVYGVGAAGGTQGKPVVVFVHGGAWSFGHKWQYALVGEFLAAQGALVAVINYRTFPAGSAVDMVDDVDRAVFWVADHCREFGGDERRIYLSGHSSGAHIGALGLTLSALRVASRAADSTQRELVHHVAGFIGLSAPYHIADHYQFESARVVGPINGVHEISSMKPAMLGERNFDRLSPTVLLEDAARQGTALTLPPFHLIHGVDDTTVPTSSSKRLAAALRQAGQPVEYVELRDCTHEGLVFAAMGDPVPCREAAVKHIRRVLFGSPPAPPSALAAGSTSKL